jgi:hypothetical protein
VNPKSTHVECVVEIEVIMTVKVAPDKFIDFGFACCMQVLKFVHRLEFNDIQTIRKYTVWFPFQQVFTFIGCDVRNGCEHISAMCCRTFYAVSVIDSSFSSFMVDIKILQIVIEINGTGTEIAAEERCMCREYSSDVDMSLTAKGDGDTCLPFMEVCNNSCCQLTGDVLSVIR